MLLLQAKGKLRFSDNYNYSGSVAAGAAGAAAAATVVAAVAA